MYDESLPAFSATGYREAFDDLDGRLTLDQATERNIGRNRQLARRQRTWFRAEPGIDWLDGATPGLVEDALELRRPRPGVLEPESQPCRIREARLQAPTAERLGDGDHELLLDRPGQEAERSCPTSRSSRGTCSRASGSRRDRRTGVGR